MALLKKTPVTDGYDLTITHFLTPELLFDPENGYFSILTIR